MITRNIIVKLVHEDEDRVGEVIQNELFNTEAQAVEVAAQSLYAWYHARKFMDIEALFQEGLQDGHIVGLNIGTLSPGNVNYRLVSKSISISGETGVVKMQLRLEGSYEHS